MTATPSVPPSRRVASLTAEPTPALSLGTTPMIASVAGALVKPMPMPYSTICAAIVRVARGRRTRRDPRVEAGDQQQAAGDDELGAEAHGELGPEHRRDTHRRRDGQQVHAGRQRAVALDELEVLGHQEDEPEQREEGDGHRAARGGEARVAEQADVEHRLGRAPLPGDEATEQHRGERRSRRCCARCSSRGRAPR